MAVKVGKPPRGNNQPGTKLQKPKQSLKKKTAKASSHILSQPQRDEKKQHNIYMWKQDIPEFKKLCALLGDQANTFHTLMMFYKEHHNID